jgi:integrase/recombinase XerD
MSIESRGGKFLVRIYMGNGRYLTKTFDTRKEAKEYHLKMDNFKNNVFDKTVSSKTILNAVFERYLIAISEKTKDSTVINYRSRYNKWIKDQLGNFQIGDINHLTLTRSIENIKKDGASDGTVKYVLIVLNELFKFASSSIERYINYNPMDSFDRSIIQYDPTTSVKYWSEDQTNKFLTAISGSHYFPLIVIMLNTGLRISEAISLRKEDIDFNAGIIRLSVQLTDYSPKTNEPVFSDTMLCLSSMKNSKGRIIPLNKTAINFLKKAVDESSDNYFIFSGKFDRAKKVIIKRGSKPHVIEARIVLKKNLNSLIEKAAKTANIDDIGPHGLRHTFAANFLMNGGDIYTLSRILGHKSINSTMIYSHLSESFLKSAINIVSFGD